MGRTPCCEKIGLKRGRWTAEEDEILINYIKKNGDGSWRSLPKNAGLLRCGKSCRLRWINYLRADLKRGNFSREEEETIIKLHRSVGNKWSLIANNLPGRTDNEVKNYWNSHLSRKIYSFRSCNGSMVTTIDMMKMGHSTCKRKGGRVSRAVAKKYNMTTVLSKTATSTTSSLRKTMKFGATHGIHKEATTAENPEVGCSGSAEEIAKNDFLTNLENHDKIERESINGIIRDFNFDGPEGCPGILMESAETLQGENEVLGPDGEPDDVTLLLDQILPVGLMDLREGTENLPMDSETALINNEIDNSIINLHPETGNLYDCFSPLNSYFNHDSVTWDAEEYAGCGFKLWDDEGDDIIWQ